MKFVRRYSRTASTVARFLVLVLAGHLSNVAVFVFVSEGDRSILGLEVLDARPVFLVTTVVGVFYAFEPRVDWLRNVWIVLFTLCTWGRTLSLVFIGSPTLRRGQELAGISAWFALFGAGVLATLVLTASTILADDRR